MPINEKEKQEIIERIKNYDICDHCNDGWYHSGGGTPDCPDYPESCSEYCHIIDDDSEIKDRIFDYLIEDYEITDCELEMLIEENYE